MPPSNLPLNSTTFGRLFQVQFREFGIKDADRSIERTLLKQFPIKPIADYLTGIGVDLGNRVVQRIERQPSSWPPLSWPHLRMKLSNGYDSRMLVMTGAYMRSIGVQQVVRSRFSVSVLVGVPNKIHEESKLSYSQLGKIHEYGARLEHGFIPPRPHWGPIMQQFSRESGAVRRNIMRIIFREVEKALRKRSSTKPVDIPRRRKPNPPPIGPSGR